jgi:hypothetical protein
MPVTIDGAPEIVSRCHAFAGGVVEFGQGDNVQVRTDPVAGIAPAINIADHVSNHGNTL